MAARDRNLFAWQAYVIVMSFVSFGLLLGMFFLWSASSTNAKKAEDALARSTEASNQLRTASTKIDRLKSMLGVTPFSEAENEQLKSQLANEEDMKAIEATYASDMAQFEASIDPNNRNYQQLAKILITAIKDRNIQIQQASAREKQLRDEMLAAEQRDTQARDAAVSAQKKAETDLRVAQQNFAEEMTRRDAESAKVNDQLREANRRADAERRLATTKIQELDTKVTQLTSTVQDQAQLIVQLRGDAFDKPQGRIVDTDRQGAVVWIDLGRADGLEPGVRFSILNSDTLQIADAKPKAKIAVTRIVDDHLAQARVLDDVLRNPVVPGDLIYSPAWRPGRKVQFALLGKLDIDGDLIDDRELVKQLIIANGGEIDEELTPEGKSTGQITPNTRYLVVGEPLKVVGSPSSETQALAAKYRDMQDRAKQFGAVQMSLDKLLGYLQSTEDDRVVPLGSGIRGSDFAPKSDTGSRFEGGSNVSELFRQRRPPGGTAIGN